LIKSVNRGSIKSINWRSVKSVKSVNIRLTWIMKKRFIFSKEKKKKKIKRFVLTKTKSFCLMSVRLIGRNKGGLVRLPIKRQFGYRTDF